jgi:hypothetical protein
MISKISNFESLDQLSGLSHTRLAEQSNKIDEFSLEPDAEEDDQQINVIVEENSNDFTNRKENEKNTPLKRNIDNSDFSRVTPTKSVLNSKQIVSDLKSD